jgi:SAM-dependent methyltransferase
LTLPGNGRPLELIVCNHCEHATRREDRSLEENAQIQAEHFDKSAHDEATPRWPNRLTLIARQVQRLSERSGKALDIGCGTGAWLAALDSAWHKCGIDVSSVSAEIARKKANAEVFCGQIEEYDAAPASFDLITAFKLIEHVRDPRWLVEWAYRHLKPNGLLVLLTGDRTTSSALQMRARWPLYGPFEHLSFFSGKSLSILVEGAGFEIVRREWRYTGYADLTLVRRINAKLREIVGSVTQPAYDHDHLLVYGRKNV